MKTLHNECIKQNNTKNINKELEFKREVSDMFLETYQFGFKQNNKKKDSRCGKSCSCA